MPRKYSRDYLDITLKRKKKTKQPSCEREAAEKSYQRSGGKKVHLIISMQERRHHGYAADRRRRSLLYFFPCRRLPLRFGSPCFLFLSFSDGVSPRLAVPPCARLRGGARLRQQQSLALNHHASGRIAGLRMISLFSLKTPLDRAKERFHSDLPPLVTPQQHLQRRLTASAANSKPD